MHNGDIANFAHIKRALRRQLSDEMYGWIKGQTDSEHMFALYMDIFNKHNYQDTAEEMGEALIETIRAIKTLQKKNHVRETNYINAALTDGLSMVAIRYVSDKDQPAPSLHYSVGKHYQYYRNGCHMLPTPEGEENGAVLIVSEKLDRYRGEWFDIPINHMMLVRNDLSTNLKTVK
jgi:predicted glutamine amidotransferase